MSKNSTSRLDTPFVLLTFCVFAISVFLVLILSGSAYRNMVDMSAYGQNERIVLSYIRTKVRQADTANSINIEDFGGVPALTLREYIGMFEFATRIYHYDGWLHEIFYDTILDFRPGDGIPIVPIERLEITELENGIIEIMTNHGYVQLLVRTGTGVR